MDRRRQSILGNFVHSCLLLSILLVAGSRGCVVQECIDTYEEKVAEQSYALCGLVAEAQKCIEPCGISAPRIAFEIQLNEIEANNCSGDATPAPPLCDSPLPDFDDNLNIVDLEDPVISYRQSDSTCPHDLSEDKSHCSMFTYSHVRQFSHSTIQTCSVTGLLTMVNNSKLSVVVTAHTDGKSAYSNLHTIQLLIKPDYLCTGPVPLLYTASASEELPLGVSSALSLPDTGPNSVEVNVSSNRTVVSIRLPWAGTTIIIHRYANHLGIVVHMPTEMARLEKGLCGVGCSEGSQIDTLEHIKQYCPNNQESSMLSCKSKSSLLRELHDTQLMEQYLTACQIDVLNSQAYDVISMMSAVVATCKLLPTNDEVLEDVNDSSASGSGEGGSGFDDMLPTLPPVELDCTHLSGQSPSVQLLTEPEMSIDLSLLSWLPDICEPRMPKGDALRQCAMFTHSHLKPFDSTTLQTPSQPGTWTLLQYESLLVEVTGAADPISSGFAKLETVSVTLQSPTCTFGVTLSYSASASSPLAQEMAYSDPSVKAFLNPMLLDSDGNVTSMRIPMLNATIVIRRDDGFLSVIAQVPAQFVPSIEGLCSDGFPDHSPDDFNNFLLEQASICPAVYQQVLFGCFLDAQDPNVQLLDNGPAFTLGFNDACQFDILKSLSYDGLSMIRSVSSDLVLLWDVGVYVYPEDGTGPPEPSLPPSPTSVYSVTEIPTDAETEYLLESPSPLPSSLVQSSSSLSVSTSPTALSVSTGKKTRSVSIPALQETPMPTKTPTERPETPRPSGRPKTPRPSKSPTGQPETQTPTEAPTRQPETSKPQDGFQKPLEDPLSQNPSSGKTHCYTLSLLSLLVALSLTLAFHLL